MILDTLACYGSNQHILVDIGGGSGLFAEVMRDLNGQTPIVIEPGPHLAAVCREKSISVVEKFLEQLKYLMVSGDLLIFTTLSGGGVDIQVLWEESKSVTPPHHLNFLNPRAVEILVERLGLETLEITIPGKLDIDILANNQDAIKDRFWKTFVAKATEVEKIQWQQMISSSGWSSLLMVVCRKP